MKDHITAFVDDQIVQIRKICPSYVVTPSHRRELIANIRRLERAILNARKRRRPT